MSHRMVTTDPVTGHDIRGLERSPCTIERGSEDELAIYFESEESKRAYMDIPIEHPIDHHINLDNPTNIMIDEG